MKTFLVTKKINNFKIILLTRNILDVNIFLVDSDKSHGEVVELV